MAAGDQDTPEPSNTVPPTEVEAPPPFRCIDHPFKPVHILLLCYPTHGYAVIFSATKADRTQLKIRPEAKTVWQGEMHQWSEIERGSYKPHTPRVGVPEMKENKLFYLAHLVVYRSELCAMSRTPFYASIEEPRYFYSAWALATGLHNGDAPYNQGNLGANYLASQRCWDWTCDGRVCTVFVPEHNFYIIPRNESDTESSDDEEN